MLRGNQRLWIALTSVMAVILLLIVYPILVAKFSTTTAILLCGLLVLGMVLHYVRGALLFRNKK